MFSLHHISLSVDDLQKSAEFYECFGFKKVFEWESEDGRQKTIHLKLDEVILELLWISTHLAPPAHVASPDVDILKIGVKHLSLQVKSILETRNHLLIHGFTDDAIVITKDRHGHNSFFIKDPNGVFLQIIEDHIEEKEEV